MPRPKCTTGHSRRDEWESHRRELSRLFTVEAVPVAGIAKYMRQKHGFDRKLKDYEYRFKKWNLRRNLHKNELRFIQSQLLRRRQAGRPSEIVVSGIRWSESMVLGRLERHKGPRVPGEQLDVDALPEFLARVQTPSLLMSDLPEWPKELPWLQFNSCFHQSTLATNTIAAPLIKSQGQAALLIRIMRPCITAPMTLTPREDEHLHSPRKMRAILEVIAPQAHEGDHETTAEILHTGSQESLAVELVRLFIYLDTNCMARHFQKVTGCNVDLSISMNAMDFLRRMGFLTKANIAWLGSSRDYTSQVFLERLVGHSILDENGFDILASLIPSHFDVNKSVQVFEDYWHDLAKRYRFLGDEVEVREHGFCRTLLQASSLAGNIHAVTLLLDLGADPYDTCGPRDFSPLECAASLDHHDRATIIADLLLSKRTRSSSEFQKDALEGALQLAISNAHTELVMRLLTERKRLGHGAICSQHFNIAAEYADCDMIRLLFDISSEDGLGSILLPGNILLAAVSRYCDSNSLLHKHSLLDKVKCLLDLRADPAVLQCTCRCGNNSLLYHVVVSAVWSDEEGERFALDIMSALRTHGCPSGRPKPTSGGDLALKLAICSDYPLLVRFLLDWGIDIDHDYQDDVESLTSECEVCDRLKYWASGVKDYSPLLTALKNHKIEIAKMLLKQIPNLKLRGGEQEFAMVAGDDTELVTMLLQAGSTNVDGWKDFLEQAIFKENPRSIRLLLSIYPDDLAAIDPAMILRAAMLTGDQDLAYQQMAVCSYDSASLFHAVVQSHTSKDYHQIVERLLETRPKTWNDDFEVAAVAAAAAHQDMYLMRVLMRSFSRGPWVANIPSINENTGRGTLMFRGAMQVHRQHILDFAASLHDNHGDSTVITTLLRFNVPAIGMRCCCYNEVTAETMRQLIAAGLDPRRPLFDAVKNNMLALVEILCETKVPLNTMEVFAVVSRTAAQLAVEFGSPEMLQLLLNYGADVGHAAGGFCGATCLQLAAGAGNIGLVRLLLDKGVKVNEKRSLCHGRTAIEIAAENGRLDVLKLLLLQKEQLFQTTAQRYQFIRAAKMVNNGHGVIDKMLREHINWNSEDQRLFDEIQGSTSPTIHLDDMTEMLLDSEKRGQAFRCIVKHVRTTEGEDIYDIEGIEQWIGDFAEETSGYSTSAGTDYSSEGEDSMTPENGVTTSQFRTATQENIVPAGEALPAYEDIHAALVEPTDLHGDLTGEQSASQFHAWNVNSETGEVLQASAPSALRYRDLNPVWLEMQDHDIDNMMQDLSGSPSTQGRTWEGLAHRPAAQSVSQEPGRVLGEVLDEVPYIHDMDIDAIDHNEVGDIDEAEDSHMHQFNWGEWDEETAALHSAAWENSNIGIGSAGSDMDICP